MSLHLSEGYFKTTLLYLIYNLNLAVMIQNISQINPLPKHTNTHTHTHTQRDTHTHAHTHRQTHTHTRTNTHTHTHRDRHTHAHTNIIGPLGGTSLFVPHNITAFSCTVLAQ